MAAMMSTRLYSYPPSWTKKPFGPCTFAIATTIVASTKRPAMGVNSPSRNRTPAVSSPLTATPVQNRAGFNPRPPKKPAAAPNPGPPNHPKAFWAPCARNTAPSVSRSANNPRSANIGDTSVEKLSRNRDTLSETPEEQFPVHPGSWGDMPAARSRVDVPLRLFVVLARAFDAVERHSRASIARFGLGTTEFGVLEVLYHKGELPVCDVQRRILVESSSTTYVVDKLVKRGLVRRRQSGTDRRVVLLALTPAGRRLIHRIFPRHAHAMRQAVAALPPREQARAVRLLRALGLGAAERLGISEEG